MNNFNDEDFNNVIPKILKSVCCESYKTPMGRCFNCPEYDLKEKNDENYE